MPYRTIVMLFVITLAPACSDPEDSEQRFQTWFDDPFELELRVDDGIDSSNVKCGLFDANPTTVDVIREDGTNGRTTVSLWVNRADGSAEAANPGLLPSTSVGFAPILDYPCQAGGIAVLDYPEEAEEGDSYSVFVWYDNDSNGLLDIAGPGGESEFGVAPNRESASHGEMRGYLSTIEPTFGTRGPVGQWGANMISDSEEASISSAVVADELTGWLAQIDRVSVRVPDPE